MLLSRDLLQSSFPVAMSPSESSLSSPSDVSLVPPPGSELRCPDAGRYCWTFEAHLDQVEMPMVPMRRTQQVKKTFRIAPCGPTKIPAIILGDVKDILAAALRLRLTAANYCRLSESYCWQPALFGARFRCSTCSLLHRYLRRRYGRQGFVAMCPAQVLGIAESGYRMQ